MYGIHPDFYATIFAHFCTQLKDKAYDNVTFADASQSVNETNRCPLGPR